MNSEAPCCSRATLNWIGVLGAFVVMGVLVAALKHYSTVSSINLARAQERRKILADVRQKAKLELEKAAWVGEKSNGIVQLPNSVAVALAIQQWQDPAKARAELLQRAEKAFFIPPPPPPPPEPKNPFE